MVVPRDARGRGLSAQGSALVALHSGGAAGATSSSWQLGATLTSLVAPVLPVDSKAVVAWSVGPPDPLQW